jgi:predicted small secreted protein
MRKMIIGVAALVAVAALLTGCGSNSGTTEKDASNGEAAASKSASPSAKAEEARHEVTLQVTGMGTTQIMYHAKSDGFGQQQLPWTVELTAAEQKVG